MRRVIITGILFAPLAAAQVITTLAGTSWVFPNASLPAKQAPLGQVRGVAIDSQGNIYLADPGPPYYGNALVLKITPGGILSVYAGNGQAGHSGDNGPAVNASINAYDVAVDSGGNVYIQDGESIRMVTPSGAISTIAGTAEYTNGGSSPDGPATSVSINALAGMAFDKSGTLYFADTYNHCIRKISNGNIVTVAGQCGDAGYSGDGGPATAALLNQPSGLAFDSTGNTLYISDTGNDRIRAVSSGNINTLIAPGTFVTPTNIAADSKGNLYISDVSSIAKNSNVVYKYNVATNAAPVVYAGIAGPGTFAELNTPSGLALDGNGNLYIADSGNLRLREVSSGGTLTTVAGNGNYRYGGDNGQAINAQLNVPAGMALDKSGNLYFADSANNRIRMVSSTGVISTIAGNGQPNAVDGSSALAASFNNPTAVALDGAGNLYVADAGNGRVRKVAANGTVTTIAGGGTQEAENIPATSASLLQPMGVAVDASGNVYISDASSLCSKVYVVKNGQISTFVGSPFSTSSTSGCFGGSSLPKSDPGNSVNQPQGLALDSAGNLYIADTGNNLIRKVSQSGSIATVGTGLTQPTAVAVDASGNIYVAEGQVGKVLEIAAGGGAPQTIAGNGSAGYSGDGGSPTRAALNQPQGVLVNSSGAVMIADSGNFRIRQLIGSATSQSTPPPTALPPPAWSVPSTPIAFSQASVGATVAPQIISLTPVANTVNGVTTPAVNGLSYAASADAASVLWLSVSPTSGNMPAIVTVTATPGNLAPGTYNGTITISSPNTATPIQTVNVSLTVPQPPPPPQQFPAIGTDVQNGVTFTVPQNSGPATSTFHISNTGSGTLSFTTTISCAGSPWLSISPSSGTVAPGASLPITATATPGSTAPGIYTCSIVVAGATPTVTIPITLTINGPTAIMLVSESAMTFTAVSGGGSPLPHNFGILNTGSCPNGVSVCPMVWQATATSFVNGALTTSDWMSLSPSSGTVQEPYLDVSTVAVTVNPANLQPGTYYGRITVSSNSAINNPVLITVTVNVLPAGFTLPPEIYPTGLVFTGVAGQNPSSQNITVGNSTNTPTSYQTSFIPITSPPFNYKPLNAVQSSGQPTTVYVYPDFSALAAGSIQHGSITFQFQDGTLQNVSVLAVVAPGGTTPVGTSEAESHVRYLDPRANGCTPKSTQVVLRSPGQSGFSATVGQGFNIEAQVTDSCGSPVTNQTAGAQVFALFGTGTKVNMSHVGNPPGVWQGTWTPSAAGSALFYVGSSIAASGLNVGGQSSTLSGTVNNVVVATAPPAPLTSVVQHAASFGTGLPIAPGELITVWGQNLASTPFSASGTTYPTQAGNVQALLGVTPLPILFTNSGQMNVQVPFNVPVGTTYQLSIVSGTSLSVPQTVTIAAAVPGIFTINEQGTGQGAIDHSTTCIVADQNNPASIGEYVTIYCTGLGLLQDSSVTAGSPPAGASSTVNPVIATIGGVSAQVAYAGVTPGFPGLYQVNAVIPQGIQTGDNVPVQISIAGQTSQAVTISVH